MAANVPSAVPSYGADDLTAQAADAVREFLGCHSGAAVVPTISGIASDALGLTPHAHPTTAVYVHEVSHLNLWQCGALGFYTVSATVAPQLRQAVPPSSAPDRTAAVSAAVSGDTVREW